MRPFRIACPVHDLAEVEEALSCGVDLDIAIWDFKRALGIAPQEYPGRLMDALRPYQHRISSAHLCNDYDAADTDGVELIRKDIDLLAGLGVGVGVLHLHPPRNLEDVRRQLSCMHSLAVGNNVTIAIENLPDSRNRSAGFRWIQDPATISTHLADHNWAGLGICLDTSHAICCGFTDWHAHALRERLVCVHLSGSLPGKDLHQAIDTHMHASLLNDVARAAEASPNNVIIISEQLEFPASLAGAQRLRQMGW